MTIFLVRMENWVATKQSIHAKITFEKNWKNQPLLRTKRYELHQIVQEKKPIKSIPQFFLRVRIWALDSSNKRECLGQENCQKNYSFFQFLNQWSRQFAWDLKNRKSFHFRKCSKVWNFDWLLVSSITTGRFPAKECRNQTQIKISNYELPSKTNYGKTTRAGCTGLNTVFLF